MEEKERFVVLAKSGRFTVTQLCEDFGISRKTAHKYLERYSCHGRDGLRELSRRPHCSPNTTCEQVQQLILKERRQHPTWGPKKIQVILETKHGLEQAPAQSTIGLILKRHGLSQPRKRRAGGYRNWPLHAHQVQWEFFLVLSGNGLLLTESGSSPIGPGDFLLAPPKGEAHQIHNTGAETMELIIVADNPDSDRVRYPHSGRTFTKPERVMRDGDGCEVDFWHGEDPPAQ